MVSCFVRRLISSLSLSPPKFALLTVPVHTPTHNRGTQGPGKTRDRGETREKPGIWAVSDLGFPGKTRVLVVGFFSSLGVDRRWFWSDFSQARPESGLFGSIRSIENLVENPGFVQFPGFISRTQVFRSRLFPGCGCSQVDFGGARVTPSGHGQHPFLVFEHVYTRTSTRSTRLAISRKQQAQSR